MRVMFIAQSVIHEPQGIMYLSSMLKQAGHQVKLVVSQPEDAIVAAEQFQPDIVAYSITTAKHQYYLQLNWRLKQRLTVFSVFGGSHATFFPEMIAVDGVDGVCVGEGEFAIVDLANMLEQKNDFDRVIPNWWFKTMDGQVIRNDVRPLITDLDTLPLPDRKLVYDCDNLVCTNKTKRFMTGRGCPYNCSFCFNHAWAKIYAGKGKRVRRFSVERMLEEIKQVKAQYPLEFVFFTDDIFIIPREWLEEFSRKYPQQIGLPFYCFVRAELVNRETVKLLHQAGCTVVTLGIEAASERIRREVLNRNMANVQIVRAAKLLQDKGIDIVTTNMLGLPTGGLGDDFETLEFNIQCHPIYTNVAVFQPYPRTQLGEWTKAQGLLDGDFDDISTPFWDRSYVRFPPEEKRQIENLQRLFAIVVEFPWMLPIVKWLIKLPLRNLYRTIYNLWRGYTMQSRLFPYTLSWREWLARAWYFIRQDVI